MISYLLITGSALVLSLTITPIVRALVLRQGWVDAAGRAHRKIHSRDIPRLGGIAIVLSFSLVFAGTVLVFGDELGLSLARDARMWVGLLAGGLLIAGLGVYDDIVGCSARQKLIVQVVAALVVVLCGFEIRTIDLPFLPKWHLGWFAIPLTLFWIVGVTNAVNLIDGLDGLAAGLCLIGILPMTAVAIYRGDAALAVVCLCLVGAIAGFLRHNFYPARIFMGDTGSMFLGFMVAVVSAHTAEKVSAVASLSAPILALALPIMDTLVAMVRRTWIGKPMFSADREHIHHRLLRSGLGHMPVVLAMYGLACVFSAAAAVLLIVRDPPGGMILSGAATVAAILLSRLGYFRLGLQGTLERWTHYGAVRVRNKELYGKLRALKHDVTSADSLDGIVRCFSMFLEGSGIRYACLDVPGAIQIEWGEQAPAMALDTEQLHLELSGTKGFGEFILYWPASGATEDTAMTVLEGARDLLEEALARIGVSPWGEKQLSGERRKAA